MEADDKTLELELRIERLEQKVHRIARGEMFHSDYAEPWPAPPPRPPQRDDFGSPPKPPEPQLRIIKEGHIPPRTDGHVSWWRRLRGAI
jgi:hypothetical protein